MDDEKHTTAHEAHQRIIEPEHVPVAVLTDEADDLTGSLVSYPNRCKLRGDESVKTDNRFGGCPECGRSTRFVSLLGDNWLVCRDHRTRWCIGNIFDTYEWEWKAWRTIERYLSFFREVEPVYDEGLRR